MYVCAEHWQDVFMLQGKHICNVQQKYPNLCLLKKKCAKNLMLSIVINTLCTCSLQAMDGNAFTNKNCTFFLQKSNSLLSCGNLVSNKNVFYINQIVWVLSCEHLIAFVHVDQKLQNNFPLKKKICANISPPVKKIATCIKLFKCCPVNIL